MSISANKTLLCGDSGLMTFKALIVTEPEPVVSVQHWPNASGLLEPYVVIRYSEWTDETQRDILIMFRPEDLGGPMRLAELLIDAVGKMQEEAKQCHFQRH